MATARRFASTLGKGRNRSGSKTSSFSASVRRILQLSASEREGLVFEHRPGYRYSSGSEGRFASESKWGTSYALRAYFAGVIGMSLFGAGYDTDTGHQRVSKTTSKPHSESSKRQQKTVEVRPKEKSSGQERKAVEVSRPNENSSSSSSSTSGQEQKTVEVRPKEKSSSSSSSGQEKKTEEARSAEEESSSSSSNSTVVQSSKQRRTVESLEAMGVTVFESNLNLSKPVNISWDNFTGYNQQKREIEDTILLALRRPEVYDNITRVTRRKFESNKPRAMLFEGPPGTGKTSCARVIANEAGVPLLHLPIEVIISKWHGEAEQRLGKMFSLANELPNGAIIFLDEVDSFAGRRDGFVHETTRRILSILLRQIDGFEQDKKVILIAATNRKEDIDPALISRFDCTVYFELPNEKSRRDIAAQYAKHLTDSELAEFAKHTNKMSGRDIKDVCQQAERHWASKIIRGQVVDENEEKLFSPPLQEYIQSAIDRH